MTSSTKTLLTPQMSGSAEFCPLSPRCPKAAVIHIQITYSTISQNVVPSTCRHSQERKGFSTQKTTSAFRHSLTHFSTKSSISFPILFLNCCSSDAQGTTRVFTGPTRWCYCLAERGTHRPRSHAPELLKCSSCSCKGEERRSSDSE